MGQLSVISIPITLSVASVMPSLSRWISRYSTRKIPATMMRSSMIELWCETKMRLDVVAQPRPPLSASSLPGQRRKRVGPSETPPSLALLPFHRWKRGQGLLVGRISSSRRRPHPCAASARASPPESAYAQARRAYRDRHYTFLSLFGETQDVELELVVYVRVRRVSSRVRREGHRAPFLQNRVPHARHSLPDPNPHFSGALLM